MGALIPAKTQQNKVGTNIDDAWDILLTACDRATNIVARKSGKLYITSLALGQLCDCSSASEVNVILPPLRTTLKAILKNMVKYMS